MFSKLEVTYDINSLEKFRGEVSASYSNYFIEYRANNYNGLLETLTEKISFGQTPSNILFTTIQGTGTYVHCDVWATSLNIYLSAMNGDTTRYYHDTDEFVWETKAGGSKVRIFTNPDNMQVSDTFVAEKGDCYLLNTHVPHDVKLKQKNIPRKMLRIIWHNVPYDQIKNSMVIKK